MICANCGQPLRKYPGGYLHLDGTFKCDNKDTVARPQKEA